MYVCWEGTASAIIGSDPGPGGVMVRSNIFFFSILSGLLDLNCIFIICQINLNCLTWKQTDCPILAYKTQVYGVKYYTFQYLCWGQGYPHKMRYQARYETIGVKNEFYHLHRMHRYIDA